MKRRGFLKLLGLGAGAAAVAVPAAVGAARTPPVLGEPPEWGREAPDGQVWRWTTADKIRPRLMDGWMFVLRDPRRDGAWELQTNSLTHTSFGALITKGDLTLLGRLGDQRPQRDAAPQDYGMSVEIPRELIEDGDAYAPRIKEAISGLSRAMK